MYLIVIGWMFVVVMLAMAQALEPGGWLRALGTLLLWGLLPLAILLYILGTPARRRARLEAEAGETAEAVAAASAASAAQPPDGGGVAAADAVTAKREER